MAKEVLKIYQKPMLTIVRIEPQPILTDSAANLKAGTEGVEDEEGAF